MLRDVSVKIPEKRGDISRKVRDKIVDVVILQSPNLSSLQMATAVVAPIVIDAAGRVAGVAADAYVKADEGTKTAIVSGLNVAGRSIVGAANIPFFLISAFINFLILGFIFVLTLYYRGRGQFEAGNARAANYVRDAFLKGLGLALAAAATIFIVDFISGGFASLVMFAVYPLAGIGMLILSIIKPAFLNDITGEVDGVPVARGSAFRYFSVVFWPLFILGMIVALAFAALTTYLGIKFSKGAIDLLANAVSGDRGAGISSTLSKLLK